MTGRPQKFVATSTFTIFFGKLQSYLLQDAHQKLVNIVIKRSRRFCVFTVVGTGDTFSLWKRRMKRIYDLETKTSKAGAVFVFCYLMTKKLMQQYYNYD